MTLEGAFARFVDGVCFGGGLITIAAIVHALGGHGFCG